MQFDEFKASAFKLALDAGCSDAEIYYVESDNFAVNVLESEIERYSVSVSDGLGLRVQFKGRNGYAYTEALEEPETLVKIAMDNAASIETDEPHPMQERSEYAEIAPWPNPMKDMDERQKIELAFDLEKAMKAVDNRVIRTAASTVAASQTRLRLHNTRGLAAEQRSSVSYCFAAPVVSENGEMQNAYGFRSGSKSTDITGCADEVVKDALSKLNASPVPTGRYRVLFRYDAMADLLQAFSPMFFADRAQKGFSPLKDLESQTIASGLINIADDPFYGEFQRAFDHEGTPSVKTAVVENGVFKSFLHNLKTAKKAGVATTSNASRASAASPITVSASNFFIVPGELSYDELINTLGDGLVITSVSGLHAGVNTVSGEFSLLSGGFLTEAGKIVRSVNRITVAGTFLGLLRQAIAVGSDLKFNVPSDSNFGSPSILAEDLMVSGK